MEQFPGVGALWDDDVSEWDSANNPDSQADNDVEAALADVARNSGQRAQASTLSALAQQMLQYPVITDPHAQQQLLDRYLAGLQASATLAYKRRRSQRRVDELLAAIAAGEDAGNRLAASMFRLVRKMAMEQATNRYGRGRALTILDDLIADANVALVESFTSYDADRCPSFALYAGKVVRTTITNRLQDSSDNAHVTLPSSWLRTKRWALPLLNETTAAYGRDLTREETIDTLMDGAMKWAYERLTEAQQQLPDEEREILMRSKLIKQGTIGAIKNWDSLLQQSAATTSLDASAGTDNERTLNDTLADDTLRDETFDSVELSALHDALMTALNTFDERERNIILHRFRFVDGHAWTFAELEPKFGISAERVRQLEQKVLRILAGPDFAHLGAYLPGHDDTDEDDDTTPTRHTTVNPPHTPVSRSQRKPRGP